MFKCFRNTIYFNNLFHLSTPLFLIFTLYYLENLGNSMMRHDIDMTIVMYSLWEESIRILQASSRMKINMIQSGKIYIRGRTVVFMIIRNEQDLEGLRKIGRIVALAREEMKKKRSQVWQRKSLIRSAKSIRWAWCYFCTWKRIWFPGVTCISVNEEVAHGIPGDRVLKKATL